MYSMLWRILRPEAGKYAAISSFGLALFAIPFFLTAGGSTPLILVITGVGVLLALLLTWSSFFFGGTKYLVHTHIKKELGQSYAQLSPLAEGKWQAALVFYHGYTNLTEEEREIFEVIWIDAGGWQTKEPQGILDAARAVSTPQKRS